jgi:hypothetical protein
MQATEHRAVNIEELLDAIGAGVSDPSYSGKDPVAITLWDGRRVVANFHQCDESELDARTICDVFLDITELRPLVDRLLSEGKSFITETGEDDMLCTLIWTIAA